jgi:hypothetical protein
MRHQAIPVAPLREGMAAGSECWSSKPAPALVSSRLSPAFGSAAPFLPVNLHQQRGQPVRQRLRQVIALPERAADPGLNGAVIEGCLPGIALVHDFFRVPDPALMPSGIQHLLVIEFRKEIVEPARSELVAELVAGEFQPFLGHGEESGAGVRVGGMSRQIKTFGRRPSELAGVIVLHDGIMILPRRSFPAALENEILRALEFPENRLKRSKHQ